MNELLKDIYGKEMRNAITIIAIACLCACAAPNEQTPIQPPRTAYTAPTEAKDLPADARLLWGTLEDAKHKYAPENCSDELLLRITHTRLILYQGMKEDGLLDKESDRKIRLLIDPYIDEAERRGLIDKLK